MPRSHKKKGPSHAKCHHTCEDSPGLQGPQHTVVRESASPPDGQANPFSFANACTPLGAAFPISSDADVSYTGSGTEGSGVCMVGRHPHASILETFTQPIYRDALTRKVSILVEFLLRKFQKSEQFTDADMLKVVNKKYKTQFSEILRKSSSRMEMIFGMQLKKINTNTQSYAVVTRLDLSTAEILSGKRVFPKMGLLMAILGLIFTNGNYATEEEIWQFLHVLGVYAWRKHLIFGEPRKFITKDLVKQNYLAIHKISEGKSSSYDFLWGSRAHVETSKMKVLEVWAKINDTDPRSFPAAYEEALKDEMERTEQSFPALACTDAMARVHPKCMSCGSFHK